MKLFTGNTRKWWAHVLCWAMLLSLATGGWAGTASAKETRAAIAVSVTGTVMVTKAGGSNEFRAYADMSLAQGDHIRTESGSSIVLQIVDQEDEVTIGPDSDLYISSLMESGGAKKSKLKMWAGSVWFKVKKLVNADDEFELETSTAVMGVRGSNGYIESKLGQLFAMMASGTLATQSTTSRGDNSSTTINPGQQITMSGESDDDFSEAVSGLDIDTFVTNASPEIIERLLTTIQEIKEENEQFMNDVKNGTRTTDPNSGLQLGSSTALSQFGSNLSAIFANVAKSAVDSNKIEKTKMQEIIDKANSSITGEKIDLNNVPKFDRTAGMDPDVAKAREELEQKKKEEIQKKQESAQKLLIERQQQLADILKKLEETKKQIEEQNKKAQEEAKKAAEDKLKSTLSEAEKLKFEQDKAKAEETKKQQEEQQKTNTSTTPPTTSPTTSPGGTPPTTTDPGSSDPTPTAPAAPTDVTVSKQTITSSSDNSVEIKAKGPAGAIVQLLLNGIVANSQPVQGSNNEVRFTVSNLSNGTYTYQLRSTNGSLYSAAVNAPTITVNVPPPPAGPSSTAMWINSGDAYTYSNIVTITFEGVQGDPVNVELSNTPDFAVFHLIPYNAAGASYALAPNTGTGDEVRTVYGRLVNAAGTRSLPREASITLKPVPPPVAAAATFTVSPTGINAPSTITVQAGQPFYIDINLSNFTGDSAIYAVETHLNYGIDLGVDFSGTYEPVPPGTTVFGTTNPVTRLDQHWDEETHEIQEIVYIASNYPNGGVPAGNIEVAGSKRLVRFKFLPGSYWGSEGTLDLSIMVVNKDGEIQNLVDWASIHYEIQGGLS